MAFLDRYTKGVGNPRQRRQDVVTNLPSVRTTYRDGKRVEIAGEPVTNSQKSAVSDDLSPGEVENMRRRAALKESKKKKAKGPKKVVIHRSKIG